MHADGAPFVDELNAQIRKTVADEGATLVDVNAQLDLSFVGQDGLHLTEAGYAASPRSSPPPSARRSRLPPS